MSSSEFENYSKDELVAPQWLDNEFFMKVLKECEQAKEGELTINNIKITPASIKGDHYASVIFRTKLSYQVKNEEKERSIIIKTLPDQDGSKKELLQVSYIFETETGIYGEILRNFEQKLRAIGDQTVLAPNCLYQSLTPKKVIVFDDLIPQGYYVLRERPVNLLEAKASYVKLAKFHALSYQMLQQNPNCLDKYCEGLMCMPNLDQSELFKGGILRLTKLLEEVPTLRVYKPYFDKIKVNFFEKVKASYTEYFKNRHENAYYVLCHGDFHAKNMMFKNNSKTDEFEDLLLLDFQISYVGPMVNDLIYSSFQMLDHNLRTNHFDELVYHYFKHFLKTLQEIGYNGTMPTLVELRKQFIRQKYLSIFLLSTFLPIWFPWYDPKDTNIGDQDVMGDGGYLDTLYKNEKYIQVVHDVLRQYLHWGYFEDI